MQIIFKEGIQITGKLESYTGYFIQRRGKRFFSARRSKKPAPHDGQWRFILMCAEMAYNKHFLEDIRVFPDDLGPALYNAHHFIACRNIKDKTYNARDIINLKITFGL
jgi:hypothetical protein